MDPRAYVIVNRRAGKLERHGSWLVEQCRVRAAACVIETWSLADLDLAAARIAACPAPVVLAGGDGSHGAGITALHHAFGDRPLPPIGLALGGTVNTVARGWGMHGDAVACARRLLDAVLAGAAASTRRPTLRVTERNNRCLSDVSRVSRFAPARRTRTKGGREAIRLGFIVGAGLVARFFEVYEGRGGDGLVTAARIVARIFAGSFVGGALARRVLDPSPCSIEVDGVHAPFDRVSLVCASVVPDLGLGMRLTYRAGEALDRFHVVATPLGPRALGPQLPLVLAGKPLIGRRVDTLARSLVIEPAAYVIDGELACADAIEVTAGPTLDVLG